MFRALLCPSSGARQTAVAASGFPMNVEVDVFSAVAGLLVIVTNRPCRVSIPKLILSNLEKLMHLVGVLLRNICLIINDNRRGMIYIYIYISFSSYLFHVFLDLNIRNQ